MSAFTKIKQKLLEKLQDSGYAIAIREFVEGDQFYNRDLEREYTVFLPSIRYWYADPMVCEIEGNNYVLVEQFDRFKKIGRIAIFSIVNKKGRISLSKPTTIISENFHLSFPLLIKKEGNYYIMPESSADNSLRFYQMDGNPYSWKYVCLHQLRDCVDTAIISVLGDGDYYITSEQHQKNKLYNKLKIYRSIGFPKDELITCASTNDTEYSLTIRNGGPIIQFNHENYRVVQNSDEKFYGLDISIYKIVSLSQDKFEEKFVQKIDLADIPVNLPIKSNISFTGIHTYSRTSRYEVVDISCMYSSFTNFLPKLFNRTNDLIKKRFK